MKKFFAFLLIFLSGCFFNISLTPEAQPLKEKILEGAGQPKILLLDVSGFISESERSETLRTKPSMVATIKESLEKAATDKDIAGVIIKINSPGGTVTASDIIYRELMNFKEKKKVPLYACIMSIGTSGAYYISSAADKVIAQPTAVTGGIGVIALKFNISGLLTKVGVEEEVYKSGDKKDILSIFRESIPEEKKIIQTIIDKLHDRFVDVVHAKRKELILRPTLEILADGRPYTAEQALESKLIDRIGYIGDTINEMKKSLGIEKARIVSYYLPGDYKQTIYSANPGYSQTINIVNINADGLETFKGVEFLYLWNP